MGYDDEQCPSRGPGLKHVTDDGRTCDDCGKVRPIVTSGVWEWWQKMLAQANPPRKVELSGEKQPEPDEDRNTYQLLNEHEWHAAEVERWYRDRVEPEAAHRRPEPDPDYPLPKD